MKERDKQESKKGKKSKKRHNQYARHMLGPNPALQVGFATTVLPRFTLIQIAELDRIGKRYTKGEITFKKAWKLRQIALSKGEQK